MARLGRPERKFHDEPLLFLPVTFVGKRQEMGSGYDAPEANQANEVINFNWLLDFYNTSFLLPE